MSIDICAYPYINIYHIYTHIYIIYIHFCKRALQKRLFSAKEMYNFKEPTNRIYVHIHI